MEFTEFHQLHERMRSTWAHAKDEQAALLPYLDMVTNEMGRRAAQGYGPKR
jgi:hypothetical protein